MKKLFSLLCALLMCFSCSVSAGAKRIVDTVEPCYEIATEITSVLSISGTTATCDSISINDKDVVKIVATQTLEKQGFFWSWGTYDNTSWTKTANSNNIAMNNIKRGLDSGKYRLKTVATFTDKYGKTETITDYSDECTIE